MIKQKNSNCVWLYLNSAYVKSMKQTNRLPVHIARHSVWKVSMDFTECTEYEFLYLLNIQEKNIEFSLQN